jgi:hypothetical protein
MGAGCLYRHDNGEVAYWIEPDCLQDGDDFEWSDLCESIISIMEELGYTHCSYNRKGYNLKFNNGLALVEFKSTYYGDGLIIKIKERSEEQKMINLFNANFNKIEKKLARAFNKYYVLAYGTSGYTAARIPVGEYKF